MVSNLIYKETATIMGNCAGQTGQPEQVLACGALSLLYIIIFCVYLVINCNLLPDSCIIYQYKTNLDTVYTSSFSRN